MDYPVSGRAPDTAMGSVLMGVDASGIASPVGIGGSSTLKFQGIGYSSSFSIARTTDTNAYAAGDVIGVNSGGSPGLAAFELANIGPTGGGHIQFTTSRFEIDIAAIISGMSSFKLALYSVTPPSALLDNAAWTLPPGDRASFRGFLDLGSPVAYTSTLYVGSATPANWHVVVPSGGSLWAYLITNTGYTPGSGDVFAGTVHALLAG